MLSQVPAVIAEQHDDGFVAKIETLELGEEPSHLSIDVANAGVVSVTEPALVLACEGAALGLIRVAANFAGAVPGGARSTLGEGRLARERDRALIVVIPVPLRGDERRVRLDESDRQEKRCVCDLPKRADGAFRDVAVVENGILDVRCLGHRSEHEARRPVLGTGVLDAVHAQVRRLGSPDAVLRVVVAWPRPVGASRPRWKISHRVGRLNAGARGKDAVVDLSDGSRVIAALLEVLRERHDVRMAIAKVHVVPGHSHGVGAHARKEARSRRIAERELTVRSIEHDSLAGEPVDVGAVDPVRAVAAELGAEVVDRDEEHVPPRLGRGPRRILSDRLGLAVRDRVPRRSEIFRVVTPDRAFDGPRHDLHLSAPRAEAHALEAGAVVLDPVSDATVEEKTDLTVRCDGLEIEPLAARERTPSANRAAGALLLRIAARSRRGSLGFLRSRSGSRRERTTPRCRAARGGGGGR